MKYTSIHIYIINNTFLVEPVGLNSNLALNLIFFNVGIYCLTLYLFFSIFFLFNPVNIKTLADLKFINQTTFFSTISVLILFFLAGIPPFFNFVGKFLLFLFIFKKNNLFLLFIFLLFNSFVIFFYIQNLKLFLLQSKSTNNWFVRSKLNWNFNLLKLSLITLFILVFGIVFTADVFILLNSTNS